MAPHTWVIGAGGLLGSSVRRALGTENFVPERLRDWQDRGLRAAWLAENVRAFATRVAEDPARGFDVYWCAGAGIVGTGAQSMAEETRTLEAFLLAVSAEPRLSGAPGRFFLASSAGGVFGGCTALPMTEATPPAPHSDYGRAKLDQERLVVDWARRSRVSTLIGRFSNLYGPAQRLDKPQGLISQISRCMIYMLPVHIYVSLDTLRDYLFADDAGNEVVRGMKRLAEAPAGDRHVTKIYASESESSIAGLLGVFGRLGKRNLRVILGLHRATKSQPQKLQFRSTLWNDCDSAPRTGLLEGVSRVHAHQMRLFQLGRLPRPESPLLPRG